MKALFSKMFTKDDGTEAAPSQSQTAEGTEAAPSTTTEVDATQAAKQSPPSKPAAALAIPATLEGVDSDDDDSVPVSRALMSKSCPLPTRSPMFLPRRPPVKPVASPARDKMPKLDLPPSLPDNYVVPPPHAPYTPIAPHTEDQTFAQYIPQAASCPPAFRLSIESLEPQGTAIAKVQVETATPMANSPLIYEVLVSRCLMNDKQSNVSLAPAVRSLSPQPFIGADDHDDHDDELPEMEL
jgi:hypothetical protein